MLLEAAEVDIEVVERGEEFTERTILRQLRERVDIFREAFPAIALLAVGTGDVGVSIVDVAREEAARVDLRPIGAHLLAVLAHGVEVRHLVRAEDIVGILRDLRLKRRHDRELLRGENFDEELNSAREDHGLFFKVFNMGSFRQELRHIANLMAGLL